MENGADISKSNRKEENTPIHLMAIYARNEIIFNTIIYIIYGLYNHWILEKNIFLILKG